MKRSMYHDDLRSSLFVGRTVTWLAGRSWGLRLIQRLMMRPMIGDEVEGVVNEEIFIPSASTPGHKIRARVYRPAGATGPLPAMLYTHGGGYQVGVPEQANPFFADVLKRRDVVIVAPAYRLSLAGHPFPAGLNDCFDTLRHMKDNARELGIRDDAFIVAGHSAGGGMTAAVTMKAVDTGAANIAFHMPVYPMLDHRMQTESAKNMVGTPVWDRRSNAHAWSRYLGHLKGDVPDYASPALREDVSSLPPTISWVGDMEPFKDEVISFMKRLETAGVPTRFKLFEGGYHGFETVAPDAPVAQKANEFQISAFAEFYDAYIK